MKNMNVKNGDYPKEIKISDKPNEVEIDDLTITANKCQQNSFSVLEEYDEVKYVEGILLIIDKENCAKALPHAWNEKDGNYFDVTKEVIWKGEIFEEIVNKKYLVVKIYSKDDSIDVESFSDETNKIAKGINQELIKRDK